MTGSGTEAGRRAELVREHLPLVGHAVAQVAGRAPARLPRQELTAAGLLALTMAARAFDAAAGAPFAPFALARIRGAVAAELRRADWDSQPPRSLASELQSASSDLAAALGRAPSRQELAATLGCATAELDAASEGPLPGQDGPLHACVAALPPRLRTVIERHYFAQHRLTDIAADLGVDESRALQLRAEALGCVRAALRADAEASTAASASAGTGYAATAAARAASAGRRMLAAAVAERTTLATA